MIQYQPSSCLCDLDPCSKVMCITLVPICNFFPLMKRSNDQKTLIMCTSTHKQKEWSCAAGETATQLFGLGIF